MTARRVALLILILVFGASVEVGWRVRRAVDGDVFGWPLFSGSLSGQSWTFTAETRHALPSGGGLRVSNSHGDIVIAPHDDADVHVTVRKVVSSSAETRAKEWAERIQLEVETRDGGLIVGTNREELARDAGRLDYKTHLEIGVPRGVALEVRGNHGDVSVTRAGAVDLENSFGAVRIEDVSGRVTATTHHGDVRLARLEGGVRLTTEHGDVSLEDAGREVDLSVEHGDAMVRRVGGLRARMAHGDLEASEVRGDFVVEAQHSAVSARDVAGLAEIATTFKGVELRRIHGATTIEGDHSAVVAEDLDSTLKIATSFGDVHVERAVGPVSVSLKRGELRVVDVQGGLTVEGGEMLLEEIGGPVLIESRRGDVKLSLRSPVSAPVEVRRSRGAIDLKLPRLASARVDARTRKGDVSIELPDFVTTLDSHGAVQGSAGEGTHAVTLVTDRGDITVRPLDR